MNQTTEVELLPDERTMAAFLSMCQESLDPAQFESAIVICFHLCEARTDGLKPDTMSRLLSPVP